MKSPILLVFIPILIASCNGAQSDGQTDEADEDSVIVQSLVIGDPLDCGIEGKLMFPIGTSYHPEVFEPSLDEAGNAIEGLGFSGYKNMTFTANEVAHYDRNAKQEFVNEQSDDFDITNILFYDLKSGESYPLIKNDTLHILSFAIHKEFENDLIFYRAVRKDFNYDEKYNSLDPIGLFVSPLGGDTLIQVTPDNQQFIDYFYYADTQKILAKTRIDADGDTLYSPYDETNFVEMKLSEPAFGKPLFPENLKSELKAQLNL